MSLPGEHHERKEDYLKGPEYQKFCSEIVSPRNCCINNGTVKKNGTMSMNRLMRKGENFIESQMDYRQLSDSGRKGIAFPRNNSFYWLSNA